MQLTLRRLVFAGVVVYSIITCYTTFILLTRVSDTSTNGFKKPRPLAKDSKRHQDNEEWNPWGEELFRNEADDNKDVKPKFKWSSSKKLDFGKKFNPINESDGYHYVEVWGKAAIGHYFWEHILEGKLESKMNGIWHYGFKKERNIKFKFRTGPGVIPSKAPVDVQYLILLINGRAPDKIDFAHLWLQHLSTLSELQKTAVLLLGNEQCDNDWFLPYMRQHGGLVDHLFIVYDSPMIDSIYIHPWPLGVATYRGFNKIEALTTELNFGRKYMCNFMGTVYDNSSRQMLIKVLSDSDYSDRCYMKTRQAWEPNETDDSRTKYEQTLLESDLTLSPVGVNTECYRIYEACAYGSVPVIEDIMTSGQCGDSNYCQNSPLCLLKSTNPPFIFIKHWSELPEILRLEEKLTLSEKVERRTNLVQWYKKFRLNLKNGFLDMLQKSFFDSVT
ncbi:ribitol-5-phosphate xylosyltransferase 1-like [Saccoglossus kowalevskii]|uniref:Transmembrane protein 5-like n=1 Tax=Saccoglossus kowalevskii TaxID=10224 RepID=A0ABM0GYP1_SACKO|nr:PREDICTED: transmembrane protein 5-like [Saccoglossus kowalevskii]